VALIKQNVCGYRDFFDPGITSTTSPPSEGPIQLSEEWIYGRVNGGAVIEAKPK